MHVATPPETLHRPDAIVEGEAPFQKENELVPPNNPAGPVQPPSPGPTPYVWEVEQFTVTAGSEDRHSLAFLAKAFTVHNYSGMWIHLRSLDLYVKPHIFGVVYNFPAGTNQIHIRQELPAPAGAGVANVNVTAALVLITAHSKLQQPSPGTSF